MRIDGGMEPKRRAIQIKLPKLVFIVVTLISLISFSLSANVIIQTGVTSSACENELLVPSEYIQYNGSSTIIHSEILIYNNGTLSLNYLSGPNVIVYIGENKSPTSNYNISYHFPLKIPPGHSRTVFVNITIQSRNAISYYSELNYYVGDWKPNPLDSDYAYVKYFAGVNFAWEG